MDINDAGDTWYMVTKGNDLLKLKGNFQLVQM